MLLPRRADAYLSSSSCTCFPISNGQRGTAITSPSRSLALSISLYFVFRCGLIKTASSLPLDTALFASSDHKAPYLRKMPAPLGSHQRYPRDLLPAPGETFTGWVEIKRLCLSQLGVPNLSPPLGAPRLGAPSRPLGFPAAAAGLPQNTRRPRAPGLLGLLFRSPRGEDPAPASPCVHLHPFPTPLSSTCACLIGNHHLHQLNY